MLNYYRLKETIHSTFYTKDAFICFENKTKTNPKWKTTPSKKRQQKTPKPVSRMPNSFKFIFPQNLVPCFIIYLIKLMPLKKCPDVQERDLRICLLQPVMTYAKKKKKKKICWKTNATVKIWKQKGKKAVLNLKV